MVFGVLALLCLATNLVTSVTHKGSKIDSLMWEPYLWTSLSKEKKGIITDKKKKEIFHNYIRRMMPHDKKKISVFDALEKDFEKYEASTMKQSGEISLNNYFALHNANMKGINKGNIHGVMSNIAADELSGMSHDVGALENVYEDVEVIDKHFEQDSRAI